MGDHVETLGGTGLEIRMSRVERTLYGNGQPGLDEVARKFFAAWEAREEEKSRNEQAQVERMTQLDRKWNLRVAIIALIVTLIMALFNIFGPSIRHTFGVVVSQVTTQEAQTAVTGNP